MSGRLLNSFGAFRRDRRGNVAMLWGLLAAGLLGLIGLTVDFTRAQAIHTQLQNAADGAALAAARLPANVSLADRTTAARAYFNAEAGDYGPTAEFNLAPVGTQGYQVTAGTYMEGSLARLVSKEDWHIGVESEAVRGGINLEVALVLDTTGSMSGTKISTLRTAATDLVNTIVQDQQTPYYSKLALITYSVGVNLGSSYANTARGAIPAARSMSGASWATGAQRTVTGATRANPVVVTANGHGFTTGQVVYLSGIQGMTQINNRYYQVGTTTTNTFQLRNASTGANINGTSYSNWSSGGTQRAQRCQTNACEIVVTANGHGFANNSRVFITSVGGMTQINNATGSGTGTAWSVASAATNTFVLSGSVGPSYGTYSSGGSIYCAAYGCEYYNFTNADGGQNTFRVSTCATERTGSERYTDAGPTSLVSLNYPSTASNGACPSNTILPLTSNRTTINSRISSLPANGYTAGHIGAAWGWYTLSPNWNSMWTGAGQPAAYGAPETLKIMILMTDGAFNSSYCNGVIAQDTSGAGNDVDHINCNTTNGDPLAQAESICTAMKARGIIIYTVAFDMAGESQASRDMMAHCATSEAHAKTANSTAELVTVFQQIASAVSQLRVSR
jgi:Flp pilus assembly protein TadG